MGLANTKTPPSKEVDRNLDPELFQAEAGRIQDVAGDLELGGSGGHRDAFSECVRTDALLSVRSMGKRLGHLV